MSFGTVAKQPRRIVLVLAILSVTLIVTVVALSVLLTVPSVVVPPSNAVTGSSCSGTLVRIGTITPGTGVLRFECDTANGAFNVASIGPDTPTFTLAPGYTSLGYAPHASDTNTDCGTNTGSFVTPMTSGAVQQLSVTGEFDLCASYSLPNGGTLNSFTVQWSS